MNVLRGLDYEEGVVLELYWEAFDADGSTKWWWTKSKWPSREARPVER